MKVLIIDCAYGNHLGLICGDENFEIKADLNEKTSDTIILKIDELLKKKKLAVDDLDAVSVCVGPGSFTGLRVGATICKGFCALSDIKIITFTSFEALTYNESKDKTIICLQGFGNFLYALYDGKMFCDEIPKIKAIIEENNLSVCCSESVAKSLEIKNYTNLQTDIFKITKEKFNSGKFSDINFEPLYLRASQAEIEREKRQKNENKN